MHFVGFGFAFLKFGGETNSFFVKFYKKFCKTLTSV